MATRNQIDSPLSGNTGTGSFVGDTSPTLTTPRIDQINDSNGNEQLGFGVNPTAVNYLNIDNASTGAPVDMQAAGDDANIGLVMRSKGAGIIQLVSDAPNTPLIVYNGTSTQHQTNFGFTNSAATRTVTFPDADGTVTLMGNTSTGSGSVVLATSPTFVTPVLGVATGTSFNTITGVASQAEQETSTSIVQAVTPGRQQYHPSAGKAWVEFTAITTTAITVSYNVSSVGDNGTGDTTINFTTAFSTINYSRVANGGNGGNDVYTTIPFSATPPTASACRMITFLGSRAALDCLYNSAVFFGDQ